MDPITVTRLNGLHPNLVAKVTAMDAILEPQGIIIRIVQGLRTAEEQNQLYAQGRTTPGHIVTNAKAGQSYHNYGLAVDLIPGIKGAIVWAPNWDVASVDFQLMISVGVDQGLISGAKWKAIKDNDHFQLGGIPISPTEEMIDVLNTKGIAAVWQQFITGE